MKNLGKGLILLMVLLVVTAGVASAGTVRSPFKDTFCQATTGGQCADNFGVPAAASRHPISGVCTPTSVGFVGWDLTAVTGTIDTAQLTLTTYNVVGTTVGVPVELELFVPSNHTWVETGVNTSPGSGGATLASATVLLNNGTTPQTVVFGGVANAIDAETLGAHFDSLKATGSATIGVRMVEGCGVASATVFFNDMENTGNLPGGAPATEPDLLLFDPTAISLSFMDAQNPNQGLYTAALITVAILFGLTIVAIYFGVPARLKQKRANLE